MMVWSVQTQFPMTILAISLLSTEKMHPDKLLEILSNSFYLIRNNCLSICNLYFTIPLYKLECD